MTNVAIANLAAPWASLIIALLSGGIALRNRSKTDSNSLQIQHLKGSIDRDLEMLKAQLSHGQVVSSTQWNAEFSSYQAIWKGMVAVRTLATKMVLREGELADLGLPEEYLASDNRVKTKQKFISEFIDAAQRLLVAIHDNAPFYPASIRKAANDTHSAVIDLVKTQFKDSIRIAKGEDIITANRLSTESLTTLHAIIDGVDLVESMIRDRLAAVEVANSTKT